MQALILLAQMILLEEMTDDEADKVWTLMQSRAIPDKPSKVLTEIRTILESVRNGG